MNRPLKIMLWVAGGLVGLAIVFIIVALIIGATRGRSFLQPNSEKGAIEVIKNLELNEFQNVYIDIDVGEVKFVEAENFGVEINYDNDGKANYQINDKTLVINCSAKKNLFGIFNFNKVLENVDNEIIVYIQKDYPVNVIRIDNNCGNIEIKDIDVENLDLNADLGNVILSNLQSDEIEVECSCGNIQFNNVFAEEINIKNDLGNIDGNNIQCQDIYAKNSCGNTSIDGILTGSIKFKNDLGNCTVKIKGQQTDYNFGLNTSLGNVFVGGVNQKSEFNEQNNATNDIIIDNSCGDILVDFVL